jgi:peptidoglycan-associated lipoprotein
VNAVHLLPVIIWLPKGVNAARIRIISYGKERPATVGSNEAAWRLNRRAESMLN